MDEKFTAIYVMVREDELKPEDKGSYEAPLEKQKEQCMRFLTEKMGGKIEEHVEVYRRRGQFLMDLERHRIKRLVIHGPDRLGANREDIEAILFELEMEGVEVLSVTGK